MGYSRGIWSYRVLHRAAAYRPSPPLPTTAATIPNTCTYCSAMCCVLPAGRPLCGTAGASGATGCCTVLRAT
jgi:hypothetical protein